MLGATCVRWFWAYATAPSPPKSPLDKPRGERGTIAPDGTHVNLLQSTAPPGDNVPLRDRVPSRSGVRSLESSVPAKYARKRATFREMSIGPEEAESILATTRGNLAQFQGER